MTTTELSHWQAEHASSIQVRPLTPVIGAVLTGIDLRAVADEEQEQIRAALLTHKVIFFRDQELDADTQIRFAEGFGPLTQGHPTLPSPDGQPLIFELDAAAGGRADHWHTDVTFAVQPPAISVLRAVQVPDYGGDTQWANTEAGYASLPPQLQRLASELRAVHTNTYDYGRTFETDPDEVTQAHRRRFLSTKYETEHPVVRLHPDTGKPSLLLGGFADRLVGLPAAASRSILNVFASYIQRPEHIVRWHWKDGDVAVWDNRSTQHFAINDYGDAHRVMNRVTVAGVRPIGISGDVSEALSGDNASYQAGAAAAG